MAIVRLSLSSVTVISMPCVEREPWTALPIAPPATAPATPPATFDAVPPPIWLPAIPPSTAPVAMPRRVVPGRMSTGRKAITFPKATACCCIVWFEVKVEAECVGAHAETPTRHIARVRAPTTDLMG
jgi:hypothetical protein